MATIEETLGIPLNNYTYLPSMRYPTTEDACDALLKAMIWPVLDALRDQKVDASSHDVAERVAYTFKKDMKQPLPLGTSLPPCVRPKTRGYELNQGRYSPSITIVAPGEPEAEHNFFSDSLTVRIRCYDSNITSCLDEVERIKKAFNDAKAGTQENLLKVKNEK